MLMHRLPRRLSSLFMQSSLDAFWGKRPASTGGKDSKKPKRVSENGNTEKASNDPPLEARVEASIAKPVPSQPTIPAKTQVEYIQLADTFEKIEQTTKRLEITSHCAKLFEQVLQQEPKLLPKVAYLCINRLGPDYEGLELGLGESLIVKALAESTGRSIGDIKKSYVKLGDLGTVALGAKRGQRTFLQPKPLTVDNVFAKLTDIAKSQGSQSQSRKIDIIKQLLIACRGSETKFIVRSLEGKLRIGLAEKTVLIALAEAFVVYDRQHNREPPSTEEAVELVKDVFCQLPNYEMLVMAILEGGLRDLRDHVKLTPGVPLKPMLAKPVKSITEVLDRFQNETFTCEYKYDGERAQVHCTSSGSMHVFSRNMEDMSQRYPDILEVVPRIRKEGTTDFIVDCEAVAWDREQKKILPFQVLSTRKRKDVESGEIKVRVYLFVFDCLYLNGKSLLHHSLKERRELIEKHLNFIDGEFSPASHMDTDSIDAIQAFLDESVAHSCEGLMVKMLLGSESAYEPSKRSRNWLKLKKDYLDGVGDSLDLVVLGAYYGRGKRTNWYGGFLLGSYNTETEEYESVCKIGTGFSEADLQRFHAELSPLADSRPKSYVSHDTAANQQPDVWFEPRVVWEVLTADLSLSPVYRAGLSELGKGISLRFPRYIREREDKTAEDATTSADLVEYYRRQVAISNS